jgi:HlyD family secretion protein
MPNSPKSIFPKEVIGFSVEALLNKHSTRSLIIYQIILLALITACVLLPFIKVDVNLNGTGVVQSKKLQTKIVSGTTGRIVEKNIKINNFVESGDTLFVLDKTYINNQKTDIHKRIEIKNAEIADLEKLVSINFRKNVDLKSLKYIQSYNYLTKSISDLDEQIKIKRNAYQREKALFEGNASFKAKLEEVKLAMDVVVNQKSLEIEKFRAQWNSDLQRALLDLSELENRLNQIKTDLEQYTIVAPVSGYIQNLEGVSKNGFIYPNQQLCVISPNENLLLDCYIKPTDIGLIKKDQKVKIRIDAFNYQQWGMLEAEVVEIFNDVSLLNNQEPVFTVRCKPNQQYLQLENGYKGELRKGMSFQANFLIAERSLFDLLFDKVEDWLAPNANKKIAG